MPILPPPSDAGTTPTRDAGVPIDAGVIPDADVDGGAPDDAGMDSGVPRSCQLRTVAGPLSLVEGSEDGAFDAPAVTYTRGAFDVVATFVGASSIDVHGDRYDVGLAHRGVRAPSEVPDEPPRAASNRAGDFALCFRSARTSEVTLHVVPADAEPWSRTIARGWCEAVAGNDAEWVVAYRTEPHTESGPLAVFVNRRGGGMSDPRPMRVRSSSTPGESASVTAFRDGFAWVLSPDERRQVEMGVVGPTHAVLRSVLMNMPPDSSAPGIASWSLGSNPALALALHEHDGTRVSVLDANSGLVLERSPPIAPAGSSGPTPALAPVRGAMIVGVLSYDSHDPHKGILTVAALDAHAQISSTVRLDVRRRSAEHGGIALASDGEHVAVVWTAEEDGGDAVRAMTLRCDEE